jgi:hypothetical protein
MPDDTDYQGYYKITPMPGPSETHFPCSCGVLIWDVEAHVAYHQRHGELCTVENS